jgi:hypothetical protein
MAKPMHPFSQSTREMLVGALLDIGLQTWMEGIKGLDSEVVDVLEERFYAQRIADLVVGLQTDDDHMYRQSIALMSDECLYTVVAAFGVNPFEEAPTTGEG